MARPQDQYSSVYYSTLIASLGGLVVGYAAVNISGILIFLIGDFDLSLVQQELVVSITLAFAVIGSLLSGLGCLYLGRKKTVILSSIFFIAASIFTLFVFQYSTLLLSRAIMGLAIGLAMSSVPFYISEIVPPNIRGSCLCVMILEFYLGYFIASLVNRSALFFVGWRITLASTLLPALALFIGMIYMPESPVWYYSKGLLDKAVHSLKKLRRVLDIEYEISSMAASSQTSKELQKKLMSRGLLQTVILGFTMATLIELTGAHAIFYYVPSLVRHAGMWDARGAIDASLWMGAVGFVVAFIAMLLVDHLGRRRLLFVGTSLMIVSLVMLGFFFQNAMFVVFHHDLVVLALCLFTAGFVFGFGSVGWLIIVEIYPIKLRSLLISVTFAFKWLIGYTVSRYFWAQVSFFGTGNTFWFYAVVSLVGIVLIYFLLPETKGKSLENIEKYFLKRDQDEQEYVQ